MRRKYPILIIILGLLMILGFTGFAVWQSVGYAPTFSNSGYILQTENLQAQTLSFRQGDRYNVTISGAVTFDSVEEGSVTVPRERFAHLDNGGAMAFSDGVLLDLNDLSENFINNYFVPKGLVISGAEGGFTAQTTSGDIAFGEHVWKLADNMYIIRSSDLMVHLSAAESYSAGQYAQIYVTGDNVVYIQSAEGQWMTISPDCYIKTARGVKIYPLSLLVDNGIYKLSLAKLTVGTDDAIVLSDLETRRQIVPELKVTTIDGEDGNDGSSGASGEEGEAGATGKKGEGGKNGTGGYDGANAVDESSTKSALPTMTIVDWQVSAGSLKGSIQLQDEAGYVAAMAAFSDQELRTKYPGKVVITDLGTGEKIECYQAADGTYQIAGTSTSFIFSAGEELFYFTTDANVLKPETEYNLSVTGYYRTTQPDMIYSREFINRNFTTTASGAGLSYVTATKNSLTISASILSPMKNAKVYLLTPEQNKSFSTGSLDSAGSYLAVWDIKDDPAVTGNTIPAGTYKHEFTQQTLNGTTGALTEDTSYVLRIVTESSATGATILAKQELNAKTLKPLPQWTGVPMASFHRVNGTFGATRPIVQDPKNGAVRYIYTAYYAEDGQVVMENGKEAVAATREILPGAPEPVEFTLNTGRNYIFGVTMEFFDNEKTTIFDLGRSEEIGASGLTMPSLKLEGQATYNSYGGKLHIQLHEDSNIQIDDTHPLYLSIYSDGVLETTVELRPGASAKPILPITPDSSVGHLGTVSLDPTTVAQSQSITLDLKNLHGEQARSKTYTLSVSATVDLRDGNGMFLRSLGSVSFQTRKAMHLEAEWDTANATGETAFSAVLTIVPVKESGGTVGGTTQTAEPDQTQHTYEELQRGRVTVSLYKGSGSSRVYITTTELRNDVSAEDQLLAGDGSGVYGARGYQITEDTFEEEDLSPGTEYTLEIDEITDETGLLHDNEIVGYKNIFVLDSGKTMRISSVATPPELQDDPTEGVTATPIYFADADLYGVKQHFLNQQPNISDDAIIGYELEANYDNSQRITNTITYYGFEYKSFVSMVAAGTDPVLNASNTDRLVKYEMMVTGEDIPKLAVFFGNPNADLEGQSKQGCTMHWPTKYQGGTEGSGTAADGALSRGHRYIFAYTTTYTGNRTYPYSHPRYNDYRDAYGSISIMEKGAEAEIAVGKGKVYVLNSGPMEAPWVAPSFYSYVQSTNAANATTAVRYTWVDTEGLIDEGTKVYQTPDELDTESTKVSFPIANGAALTMENETVPMRWYEANLYTQQGTQGDRAKAYATISLYNEARQYAAGVPITVTENGVSRSTVLDIAPNDTDRIKFIDIPVDRQYSNGNFTQVYYEFDISKAPQYLRVKLTGSGARNLMQRAVAIQVTLNGTSAAKNYSETFVVPVSMTLEYCYADLPQRYLANFSDLAISVGSVEVLYDTGAQGWQYAGQHLFAMQHYAHSTNVNANVFGDYVGARTNPGDYFDIPANEGAWKRPVTPKPFDPQVLLTLLTGENVKGEAQGEKYTFRSATAVKKQDISDMLRYLFPGSEGIYLYRNQSITLAGAEVGVPKALDALEIKPSGVQPGYPMDPMIPTVAGLDYDPSVETMTLKDFTIAGADGTIYIACFEDETDAYDVTKIAGLSDDRKKTVTLADGGKCPEGGITFEGLERNETYYFTFYYIDKNGKTVILNKEEDQDQQAVWPLVTIDGAGLAMVELDMDENYLNISYLEKSLAMQFTMENIKQMYILYDIYTGDYQPATSESLGTGTLLIEHDKLVSTNFSHPLYDPYNSQLAEFKNKDGILTIPQILHDEGTENTVTLDLSASENREKLKPGGTYTLVLSAYEKNTGADKVETYTNRADTEAGSAYIKFRIPAIGNYGALMETKDVTTHDPTGTPSPKITYKVTITDFQNSFMGAGKTADDVVSDDAKAAGGLYAVRFVDKAGNLVKTKYDSQVFSTLKLDNVNKTFDLYKENLVKKTRPDNSDYALKFSSDAVTEEYTMLVFAAVDTDHNGKISLGETGNETEYTYDDLFRDDGSTDEDARHGWGTAFNALIDSLWSSTANADGTFPRATGENEKAVYDDLLIASTTQATSSAGGYLLNVERIMARRINGRYRIMFDQSFNLVSDPADPAETPECVFEMIDVGVAGQQTGTGIPFDQTWTLMKSNNDTMIVKDPVTDTFYLDVPGTEEIPNCDKYWITLHLYEDINGQPIQHTIQSYI